MGALTIYMLKPEIPVVQSNGSRSSVREGSENLDCDLRRYNFSTVRSVQLFWICFVAGRSPTTSNSLVLYLSTGFPPGGFCKG